MIGDEKCVQWQHLAAWGFVFWVQAFVYNMYVCPEVLSEGETKRDIPPPSRQYLCSG